MTPPAPAAVDGSMLGLLIRVNTLQAWRRLQSIRHQSRLLSSLVALFLTGYGVLAYALFRYGLHFVGAFPGLGPLLLERLVYLLFAFLFVLLLFSNLVISYTNLFRNRETRFLLALPVPPQIIVRWKLIESAVLASWAFLFLISPLLLAYGLDRQVAWHFYAVVPGLLGLFVVLPAVLGAWSAIAVARFLDRRAFQVLAIGTAVALLGAAVFWLRTETITDEMLETRVLSVLDRLLARTRFAQWAWLPSYWLSAAVLQWSEGARTGAAFFALVLLSYTLFFGWLAFTRTGVAFCEAISGVQSRASVFWRWPRRGTGRAQRQARLRSPDFTERAVGRLRFVSPDLRALLVKDLRVFWRDTTQWGQTLVLFGLLGAYILNLRHFTHQLGNPFWVFLISYLNLGACSLNLATLTTRFVFPQFSLEGRRLWIVGMAPVGLRRLLVAKYGFASGASLVLTLGLITLSCRMLLLPADRTLYFAGAITVMTFTLNGLAIGLGTLYPNFRDDNPGKIVSGFGGTLCLVLSFFYLVVSVLLLAVCSPWGWGRLQAASPVLAVASWAAFALISVILGYVPLRLGLASVARLEI
jgi:ABC-2 type transport system permease protein